jgi:myo-inositol 2-dehydrogenase/D-chiro-inositol 1-dehydrogenase
LTVRLAILGAGIMGGDHARIFAEEIPGASVWTICDADAARACALADKVGAQHVASDPEAAIRDSEVDAVVIAAPDSFHAPLTLACIAADKPVLCEKPLSQSSRECLAVMDAEERRGKRLVQVGFMRRFDPSYVEIKNLLASGVLGKALMLHCLHRNVAPAYGFQGSMAISNSAPHEFDVARWMLDTDYKSIRVFRPGGANAAQSAPVFMVLETTGGQLVDIEVNISAAYGYDVRGELVGEKGSAFLRAPLLAEVNLGLKGYSIYPEDWRPRFAEAYRRQNLAWLRSLASGAPTGASAWDGYCSSLVAEAGVEALGAGKTVAIEQAARPSFYT